MASYKQSVMASYKQSAAYKEWAASAEKLADKHRKAVSTVIEALDQIDVFGFREDTGEFLTVDDIRQMFENWAATNQEWREMVVKGPPWPPME